MHVRSVMVVHRERIVAEGLAAALNGFPGMRVAALAVTVAGVEAYSGPLDAVALDAELPDTDGAALRLQRRGVRVVLIGGDLPREQSAEDRGIRVPSGGTVAALAMALVPGSRAPATNRRVLSPREREVLQLVAEGMAAKQVARELGISPKTVEHHKSRIFRKLEVPNQAAAVRAGMSLGLV